MRRAYLAVGAQIPFLGRWKGNRLAWISSVASVLLVITAFVIAIHAAITSGNYQGILSHQALSPFVTITYSIIGALVAARHPRNPIGWILAAVGFLYALGSLAATIKIYETEFVPLHDLVVWLTNWLWIPAIFLPMTLVLLIFPDGHLPSHRWRFVAWSTAVGLVISLLVVMFHPGPLPAWGLARNPYGVPAAMPLLTILANLGLLLLMIGVAGSLAGFFVRFRASTGIEREQMKWLAYAGAMLVLGVILSSIIWFYWPDNRLANELSIMLTNLTILGIAVAATVAILRHRLYDIDLIINRTLVYGALTAAVVALYVLLVGTLGMLFQTQGNLLVALLATGVVAVLFQPLRDRLQRSVDRIFQGHRGDPLEALAQLARRLEAAIDPEVILPTLVETIAQTLRLPYVGISLRTGDEFKVAAQSGRKGESSYKLPLIYQGKTVGQLIVSRRDSGEPCTPSDRQLLQNIVHQAGSAAYAMQLTEDLRQSRVRLVTSREEERRRLRRDLHDGLGPILASQGLKMAAAGQLLERNPTKARQLLAELTAQNEAILAEIRRLVYELRPAALDDLGLVGAIRDYVSGLKAAPPDTPRTQIDVRAPPDGLPSLPAAIEVAAYRIATEALTNVARHARARHAVVSFVLMHANHTRKVQMEIADDGIGLSGDHRSGVGLISMRERAEEVGGYFLVESSPGRGTRIMADLPLTEIR